MLGVSNVKSIECVHAWVTGRMTKGMACMIINFAAVLGGGGRVDIYKAACRIAAIMLRPRMMMSAADTSVPQAGCLLSSSSIPLP